jgi:hypothetical protein
MPDFHFVESDAEKLNDMFELITKHYNSANELFNKYGDASGSMSLLVRQFDKLYENALHVMTK